MYRSIFLILIAIGISASGQSQNTIQSIKDFQEYLNSSGEYRYQGMVPDNIQGTPYLDTAFSPGMIRYDGTWYTDIQLRFDVFNNAMQAQLNDGVIVIDPARNPVDSLILGEELFIKRNFPANKKAQQQFLVDVKKVNGYSIFKRYNADFKPATKATAYGEAKPAKYVKVSPDYFIGVADETILIKGIDTFAEVFQKDKKSIRSIMKANKLKLKEEEDLARLLELLLPV